MPTYTLTARQRAQIERAQGRILAQQQALDAYVQGIVDQYDVPDGTRWRVEGDSVIGTPPEATAPGAAPPVSEA